MPKQKLSAEERERRSLAMKKIIADKKAAKESGNTTESSPIAEKEQTVTLTTSALEALLDKKVQEAIKKEISKPENLSFSDTKISANDDSDLLEKPVVLFCFKKSYIMSGYKYRDKEIDLLGDNKKPLKFQIFTTVTRPNPINIRETQLVYISKLVVYSKSKLALIRKHPRYGVDFREELGNIESYSPEKNQYMVEAHNYVHNELTPHEVTVRLEERKKRVVADDTVNRAALVDIVAEEMYKDALSRQQAKQERIGEDERKVAPSTNINALLKEAPVMP